MHSSRELVRITPNDLVRCMCAEPTATCPNRHMQHRHTSKQSSEVQLPVETMPAATPLKLASQVHTNRHSAMAARSAANHHPSPPTDRSVIDDTPLTDLGTESGQDGSTGKQGHQGKQIEEAQELETSEGGGDSAGGDNFEHNEQSGLESDGWELTEAEGDTVLGLLRELEEESRFPPPNKPLYSELLSDLAARVLSIKKQRYTFPENIDGCAVLEESNPEDLSPDKMCWRHAGDYKLSENLPNSINCRQYAYYHMKRWRHAAGVSKSHTEGTLKFYAYEMQPDEPNGPGLQNNRYPPSIHACGEILSIPDAQTYEFHVCSRGCVHWWGYQEHASQHLKHCGGCSRCQCPHCHSERYLLPLDGRSKVREDQSVEPARKCWLFFDLFHHMFMDEEWVASVDNCRKHKLSAFHQTPEDIRLDNALKNNGFDPRKVLNSLDLLQTATTTAAD
jgi:hypothetical protein